MAKGNSKGARSAQAKARAKQRKEANERELRAVLKWARKHGVYNPSDDTLTRKRKSNLEKIRREWKDVLTSDDYLFAVNANNIEKKKQEAAKIQAETYGMKKTTKGLFVPKGGGHTKARLKEAKKTGEVYVEKTGKTKRGPNAGRKYKEVIPIVGVDELERQKDRIRDLARELGPVGKNETLVFIIHENGVEGQSRASFSTPELMLQYIMQYKAANIGSRVQFMRHMTVEKWTATKFRDNSKARIKRKKTPYERAKGR